MKKFDYMPMCFHAYLIGWYYGMCNFHGLFKRFCDRLDILWCCVIYTWIYISEPGARLLVMVASEDTKLFIYENTTLLWSCELLHTPISISRCFLKGLPGGLVTLSVNGVVDVSYVGTEPDLTGFGQAMLNETSSLEDVQKELETVEETLQKIMDKDEG